MFSGRLHGLYVFGAVPAKPSSLIVGKDNFVGPPLFRLARRSICLRRAFISIGLCNPASFLRRLADHVGALSVNFRLRNGLLRVRCHVNAVSVPVFGRLHYFNGTYEDCLHERFHSALNHLGRALFRRLGLLFFIVRFLTWVRVVQVFRSAYLYFLCVLWGLGMDEVISHGESLIRINGALTIGLGLKITRLCRLRQIIVIVRVTLGLRRGARARNICVLGATRRIAVVNERAVFRHLRLKDGNVQVLRVSVRFVQFPSNARLHVNHVRLALNMFSGPYPMGRRTRFTDLRRVIVFLLLIREPRQVIRPLPFLKLCLCVPNFRCTVRLWGRI